MNRSISAMRLAWFRACASSSSRLRRLVAEALDEPLDLGDALGLVPGLREQQLAPRLALDQVVVVVARVDGDARRAEVGDGGHHAVQEVAVVRDEDDRAVVAGEKPFEPLERFDVEVVRGLVEQEERGTQEQEARERGAHAPAAGELGERAREVGRAEAEAAQDGLRLRLEPVAAERFEPVLEVAVARRQRFAVRPVGSLGEHRGDVFHLPLDLPDLVEAGEGLGEDRARRAGADLLGQIADRRLARLADAPRVGLLDPGQQAAERRLARAVRADEPDSLAVGDAPGEAREERLAAVRLRDVLELDQPRSPWIPFVALSSASTATAWRTDFAASVPPIKSPMSSVSAISWSVAPWSRTSSTR